MDARPELHLLGVSFRTAGVEVREGLAFSPSQAADLVEQARREVPSLEAVVLSTCNRTEFYLAGPGDVDVVGAWHRVLRAARPDAPALDEACLRYERRGAEAFRHLLRVVTGLDSAILGDGQITGQVRRAVTVAQELGSLGAVLSPLFATALRVGRQARAETAIGKGAPGVGGAVAEALRARHVDPASRVVVLGTGEAARTIARSLLKAGFLELSLSGRNPAAATQVAEQLGCAVLPWGSLDAEVVVAATAAPTPVVEDVPARTRLVVDAGFPRQVAPEAGARAELVSLLALTQAVDTAAAEREAAVPAVEALVEEHFDGWRRAQERHPLELAIKQLHVDAQAMAEATAAELAERTGVPVADVQHLIVRQVRRVLHRHVSDLRTLQEAGT